MVMVIMKVLTVGLLLGHARVMVKVESVVVPRVHIGHAALSEHVICLDPSSGVHLPGLGLCDGGWLLEVFDEGVRRLDVDRMTLMVVCVLEVAIDDIELLLVTVRVDIILTIVSGVLLLLRIVVIHDHIRGSVCLDRIIYLLVVLNHVLLWL